MLDTITPFDVVNDSIRLADKLIQQREHLASSASNFGGVAMMRAYSEITDALIRRIFNLAIEEAEKESSAARRKAIRHITMAAVGGYGRAEMAPFSDVDVVFLVEGEENEDIDLVVKRAFRLAMDVSVHAGIGIGYSYRRIDEVDHLTLENQTALLDARWIAGSEPVYNSFNTALRQAIIPAAFVTGHIESRHNSAGQNRTPYMVEPDLKEGAGGLRDIHTARWIAQIAFKTTGTDVWYDLRSRGIILDIEMAEIETANEFLCRARNTLHLLAFRGLNILSVERQQEVAEALIYADAQSFMSDYYAAAACARRIYHKVADACMQSDLTIEPGMVSKNRRLCIMDRGLLARDSSALIRVFQHAHSYRLDLDRQTQDMVSEAAQNHRINHESAHCFIDMLSRPGAAAALRKMANTGVLHAIVPQFNELMALVPKDAAHQYTVGEHSLRAVEQLETMLADKDDRYADISAGVQHLDVLFLATLLHDVGKLDSPSDHAKTGAFRAGKLAAQLGMAADECDAVEFLVRRHLIMSETARLRDLQKKKTISDFAAIVKEPDLLDMLLLLTVADARSVGTKNWSQVQIRFLLELHDRATAALRAPGASAPDIERHRARVRRELGLANLPSDEIDEHCATMPASYLLNTPPDMLAAHIGYVRTVRDGSPAIDIRDERGREYTELTVVAEDRPGLLSRITGVLCATNIDVHAAQIFTRHSTDAIAIDTLYIDFEGRQLSEMKKWQLEGDLLKVLSGEENIDQLIMRMGKKIDHRPRSMRTRVLDNVSEHETVLEVRAEDTSGLLYHLTRRMSELGLDIHSARVATWGHEAQDAFYITDSDGGKPSIDDVIRIAE